MKKITPLVSLAFAGVVGFIASSTAQEAIITDRDDLLPNAARSPVLIDRVLRNEPNPSEASPTIVDGFRLANGQVAYFDSATPGAIQFQDYADFIGQNPLFEIPLPGVDEQRIAASAFNHTTEINLAYSWSGNAITPTLSFTDTAGNLYGCNLVQSTAPAGSAEPIHGLIVQNHARFEVGTGGRGVDAACRYYNYKHTNGELTAANSVVAMLARNARIEVSTYSDDPGHTGEIRYPREFGDHTPYGPVEAFGAAACASPRYMKVSVEFDYGVAGVAWNASNLQADRQGHLQGRRPDTYAATQIVRRCDVGAVNGAVQMRLANYQQASVAELRTVPDYNPNSLPTFVGDAYLTGLFHRCGDIQISGSHPAGSTVLTRAGVGSCSPASNTPVPEASAFRVRKNTGLSTAYFGPGSNDFNLISTLRHNPRFGFMVARNASNHALVYYNDRFHLWHGLATPLPAQIVSYLTRIQGNPNSNPSAPTAPTEPRTNCRAQASGPNFVCQSDQGVVGGPQPSHSEAENICVAMCGSDMGSNSCGSQVMNWREGLCAGTAGSGGHNALSNVVNVGVGYVGSLEVRCNAGQWVARQQGTCEPKVCNAMAATWTEGGATCSASLPNAFHTDTFNAVSTSGNTEGNQDYLCWDGAWQPQGAGSCRVLSCPATTVSWGDGCSAPVPELQQNQTANITNDAPSRAGNAVARCLDGVWTVEAGATCVPTECSATTLTRGSVNHNFPGMNRLEMMDCAGTFQNNGFLGIGRNCDYNRITGICTEEAVTQLESVVVEANYRGLCEDAIAENSLPIGCPIEGTERTRVNGVCGPANGQPTSQVVAADRCESGAATGASRSGDTWFWSCAGANGGVTSNCSAPYLEVPLSMGESACEVDKISIPGPNAQTVSVSGRCHIEAYKAPICAADAGWNGSSNQRTDIVLSRDHPDDVGVGSYTFRWQRTASNASALNGTIAITCYEQMIGGSYPTGAYPSSIPRVSETISLDIPYDGACGAANGYTFSEGSTGWTSSRPQCILGTPSDTRFPASGDTANWTCSGLGDGTSAASCSASRRHAAPVITDLTFTPNPTNVGQPMDIGWTAVGADRCTIEINGNPASAEEVLLDSSFRAVTSKTVQTRNGDHYRVRCTAGDSAEGTQTFTLPGFQRQDGACGSANGRSYHHSDSSYSPHSQCSIGSPSTTSFPSQGGSTSWTCSGVDGGSASGTCSASRQSPPPTCPSVRLTWGGPCNAQVPETYAGDYVNVGDESGNGGHSRFDCVANAWGGANWKNGGGECYATPTDGVCGTADGQTYDSSMTSWSPFNQCISGSPSTTAIPSQGATRYWTCSGSNGGSTSPQCSAFRQSGGGGTGGGTGGTGGGTGSCGTAHNWEYPADATGWGSRTQCASGTPSSTTFPAQGGSRQWTCSGSPQCTASRKAPESPGACGSAHSTAVYHKTTANFFAEHGASALCSAGTSSSPSGWATNDYEIRWRCSTATGHQDCRRTRGCRGHSGPSDYPRWGPSGNLNCRDSKSLPAQPYSSGASHSLVDEWGNWQGSVTLSCARLVTGSDGVTHEYGWVSNGTSVCNNVVPKCLALPSNWSHFVGGVASGPRNCQGSNLPETTAGTGPDLHRRDSTAPWTGDAYFVCEFDPANNKGTPPLAHNSDQIDWHAGWYVRVNKTTCTN